MRSKSYSQAVLPKKLQRAKSYKDKARAKKYDPDSLSGPQRLKEY
jgi:hypothetical protein